MGAVDREAVGLRRATPIETAAKAPSTAPLRTVCVGAASAPTAAALIAASWAALGVNAPITWCLPVPRVLGASRRTLPADSAVRGLGLLLVRVGVRLLESLLVEVRVGVDPIAVRVLVLVLGVVVVVV